MRTNKEKIERALELIFCDTLDADYTYKDGAFDGADLDETSFKGRIIKVEENYWETQIEYASHNQPKEQYSLRKLFLLLVMA